MLVQGFAGWKSVRQGEVGRRSGLSWRDSAHVAISRHKNRQRKRKFSPNEPYPDAISISLPISIAAAAGITYKDAVRVEYDEAGVARVVKDVDGPLHIHKYLGGPRRHVMTSFTANEKTISAFFKNGSSQYLSTKHEIAEGAVTFVLKSLS